MRLPLSAVSLWLLLVPAGVSTQTIDNIHFNPQRLQTGSALGAFFDAFGGSVQQEVNDRLLTIQPVALHISWPVNRIANVEDILGFLNRTSDTLQDLDKSVFIPDAEFMTHESGRRQIADWINLVDGALDNSDVTQALNDGQIELTAAARVLFNRQSVAQLLRAEGARMQYRAIYSDDPNDSQFRNVPAEDLRWVFRSYPPAGVSPASDVRLVAVDIVSEPQEINLVKSGEGVAYLERLEAKAEFLAGQMSESPVSGDPTPISNVDNLAGGGDENPLLIDFTHQGVDALFRQLERAEGSGSVDVGVGLGIVSSIFFGDDNEPDSYTGINVLFGDAASEPIIFGLHAGLNTRRDLYFGPGLTFGGVLTTSLGWRAREENEATENSLGVVVAFNISQLVGEERAPIRVDVTANSEFLTTRSPDRALLEAELAGLAVEIVDESGNSLSPARFTAQPPIGTSLPAVRKESELGEPLIIEFPIRPRDYQLQRIWIDLDGDGNLSARECLDLTGNTSVSTRAGELARVLIQVNDHGSQPSQDRDQLPCRQNADVNIDILR